MVKNPAAAGVAPGIAADGTLQGWVEGSKVQMFDFSLDLSKPYTILGGLIGVAVFKVAQFTTDQEFVQRQLSCKNVRKAGESLVVSQLLAIPTVLIFLCIGSLLYVKYINSPAADGVLSQGCLPAVHQESYPDRCTWPYDYRTARRCTLKLQFCDKFHGFKLCR